MECIHTYSIVHPYIYDIPTIIRIVVFLKKILKISKLLGHSSSVYLQQVLFLSNLRKRFIYFYPPVLKKLSQYLWSLETSPPGSLFFFFFLASTNVLRQMLLTSVWLWVPSALSFFLLFLPQGLLLTFIIFYLSSVFNAGHIPGP